MHFYKYLEWLCKSRGVTIPTVYNAQKINKGTISKWRSACEAGEQIHPSAIISRKLSTYFGIPLDNIFAMQDEYGLTLEDWRLMGQLYGEHIGHIGKTLSDCVDGKTITLDNAAAFVESGLSLSLRQLDILCGLAETTAPDLFSAWSDRLYRQKNKTAAQGDGVMTAEEAALLEQLRNSPNTRALLHSTRGMDEKAIGNYADFISNIRNGGLNGKED